MVIDISKITRYVCSTGENTGFPRIMSHEEYGALYEVWNDCLTMEGMPEEIAEEKNK